MVTKSFQLISTIQNAIMGGNMNANEISADDIDAVISSELEISRCCLDFATYDRHMSDWKRAKDEYVESDAKSMIVLLEAAKQCLSELPNPMEYMDKGYWIEMLGEYYDEEVDSIVANINKKGYASVFNYDYTNRYSAANIEVLMDEERAHLYVMYEGKKMYFPKSWTAEQIQNYVCGILAEQDSDSPHCYSMPDYEVKPGDIVIDAGVAEGNFALKAVDIASKIYLIEADEEWAETLRITFEPYEDKVQIVNRYLDMKTEGNHIALDDLCDCVNYIKMDIEGYERNALQGAKSILKNSDDLRLAICAYHCAGDEEWITEYLQRFGFSTKHSKGYMFPDWEFGSLKYAMLRRGLVFGKKM